MPTPQPVVLHASVSRAAWTTTCILRYPVLVPLAYTPPLFILAPTNMGSSAGTGMQTPSLQASYVGRGHVHRWQRPSRIHRNRHTLTHDSRRQGGTPNRPSSSCETAIAEESTFRVCCGMVTSYVGCRSRRCWAILYFQCFRAQTALQRRICTWFHAAGLQGSLGQKSIPLWARRDGLAADNADGTTTRHILPAKTTRVILGNL
ncbi:hypothetical protein B0H14DRAFT_3060931 [Mycena olivaceomarginata]|nr:hypothetical protein B0H14DRAFT_3060931 [Mycena olivaceomarginata]